MTVEELKKQAAGREIEILVNVAGISENALDERHHPCPRCGGSDRFRLIDKDAGAVFCNRCFSEKNGDFIAAVQWMSDCDFPEAMRKISDFLGIDREVSSEPNDSKQAVFEFRVQMLCQMKRMPIEAFRQFKPELASRGRNRNNVIRVPVYNEDGEIHSYFDMTPDVKGWFKRGKGSSGMFFPGRLPKEDETWLLVEGVKDSAALVGTGFNAAGMANCHLNEKYAKLFRGVHVIFVPDLDNAGIAGSRKSAGNLAGIAKSVSIARLPGEIRESGGDDVRDVLSREGGEALVRAAIESADAWEPTEGEPDVKDGRPEVMVTLKEGEVADQVVSALGFLGWETPWIPTELCEFLKVYVRGGMLVQMIPNEQASSDSLYSVQRLSSALVRERITQACRLLCEVVTEDAIEIEPVRPPKWLIDATHDRKYYSGNIRPLNGLIYAPTIRPDGTILQCKGYDESTALIFVSDIEFPQVPDNPTREDAARAAIKLLDVVADFPFNSDADRSAWLCLLLSLIGRPCIEGCVPLFAITANIRGAGKSMLVDTASLIAFGRPAARKTFTRDDDEMRKSITAIALEAAPSVLFDNLDRQLGGASLDAVLTATTWRERILGKSETTGDLPMKTVWSATGNNMSFGSDVSRRVLPVRLASHLESPEERTDFQHEDLLGWVSENRPQLAIAALTFLRAYFAAGSPPQPGGAFGSFESWSQIIRGAIVWAGFDDPLVTRQYATASDESKSLLGLLICGLEEADPDREGITTKELERLVSHRPDMVPTCPTLVEAVAQVCGDKFNSKRFGKKLASYVGRVWQGKVIHSEKGHNNVKRWFVRATAVGLVDVVGVASSTATEGSVLNNEIVDNQKETQHNRTPLKMGERNPPNTPNPSCEHNNPDTYVQKDDKMFCASCDKYIGRVPTKKSPSSR